MTRMSADTVARLRLAVADSDVVDRYRSHIKTGRAGECWLWTGAISGKGHGRFQIADQRGPVAAAGAPSPRLGRASGARYWWRRPAPAHVHRPMINRRSLLQGSGDGSGCSGAS